MKLSPFSILFCAAASCLLGLGPNLHAQTYTATDLGTLGGTVSAAYGINDAGQVVGSSFTTGNSNIYAALFNGTGANNTDLGALGGTQSFAYAINNSGQIVGFGYLTADSTYHAALFSGTGSGNIDLGTVASSSSTASSVASAINSSGVIVGQGIGSSGYDIATLFSTTGSPFALSSSPSYATAINSSGQIVGVVGNTPMATLFSGTGSGNTSLGTLGGSTSVAYAVNDSGEIVGDSYTSGNTTYAGFLYASGTMTNLNSLISGSSGITSLAVQTSNTINNWGQIAATGTVSGGDGHAVLLNPINPLTSVSGGVQDVKLVSGMSYTQVAAYTDSTNDKTQVSFLGGTAAQNRDVQLSFSAPATGLLSDVVQLSITSPAASATPDMYAIQLSYTGSGSGDYLAYYNVATGTWENAVLGNSNGGVGATFINGAYNPSTDFVLGDYGIDTADGTVWAVLDQDVELGVDAAPEPSTSAIFFSGLAVLAAWRLWIGLGGTRPQFVRAALRLP